MMRKLRQKNNKGVALILALGFAAIAGIASIASVGGALSESNNSQRYQDSVSALYEAERGANYAFVEVQGTGFATSWVTHKVGALDPNTNKSPLIPISIGTQNQPPQPPPTPQMGNNKGPGRGYTTIDASGNYVVPLLISGKQGQAQVRVYENPNNSDEVFIRSQATVGSNTKILQTRLQRRSLYRYFFYCPGNQLFLNTALNGQGAGGIYVNGNIYLRNVNFSNIAEFTTNATGSLSAQINTYNSPSSLDRNDTSGSPAGFVYLPRLDATAADKFIATDNIYTLSRPFPTNSSGWPSGAFPPSDWRNVDSHSVPPGKINGVDLPYAADTNGDGVIDVDTRLSQSYTWNKFGYGQNNPPPSPASQVQFASNASGTWLEGSQVLVTNSNFGCNNDTYWQCLENIYGRGMFDPDFWGTGLNTLPKNYSTSKGDVSVRVFDTDKQAADWQSWLDGPGSSLKGIIKDKNTGGYDVAMINIKSNYSSYAKQNGLYIGTDPLGNLEVYLNGTQLIDGTGKAYLPCWAQDNKTFYNTVRPKTIDSNGNAIAPAPENVLEFNIKEGVDQSCLGSDPMPNNGIVYVAHKSIRLNNGGKLPQNGLTVVSPYNVYIKGDYNTDSSWQPASVISNSMVYVLSDAFNDPQTLPATIQPREYPNELKWINTGNLANNSTKLTLINEIKNFFGLTDSNGSLTTAINNINPTASNALGQLTTAIRNQHQTEYASKMPNKVITPTTVKSAIACPNDLTNGLSNASQYYHLEQWPTNTTSHRIEGAFIRLGGSWASDGNGNPMRDIQSLYWNKRAGGANDTGQDPTLMMSNTLPSASAMLGTRGNFTYFDYATQFADPLSRPPGDFLSGSESSWQEVTDFNNA